MNAEPFPPEAVSVCEYGDPNAAVPAGQPEGMVRSVVVTGGMPPTPMMMLQVKVTACANCPWPESVTLTEIGNVPVTVGVPVIAPFVVFNDKPNGSGPPFS